MRYVCVFICFLLWLIFTLLLSSTVIGLVISVSDCRFVVSSGQLFFVDDEYAGTVKLTNLDNGESNISFPSCDDGLIINPADKHIK